MKKQEADIDVYDIIFPSKENSRDKTIPKETESLKENLPPCKFEPKIAVYHQGSALPSEIPQIEEHLEKCPLCQKWLDNLKEMDAKLTELGLKEPKKEPVTLSESDTNKYDTESLPKEKIAALKKKFEETQNNTKP